MGPGDAAALIAAWQDWAPAAPDAMAASLLLNADADSLTVRVFGAMAGSEGETTARLDELEAAAGATPTSATVRPGSYREAKRFLSGLGEADEAEAGHPLSQSEFFAQRLPAATIEALVRTCASPPHRPSSTSLPGAARTRALRARPPRSPTAMRASCSSTRSSSRARRPARPAGREWLMRSWALAHPFGTGGVYPNFPEDDLDAWDAAHHGANRERLLAVKRRYDPDDVFS